MMDYKRLYKTWTGTIPAGGSVKISMGGFYIRFLESDATGLIAVNDGDPGVAVGGLGLSLPDGFENFRLTNPNGTDWTVTVGVSEGAIEDSRLNVPSGIDVNIADDPQGAAILAMLQDAAGKRKALTSLGGSSYYEASGTTLEVVSDVANVAGAIIRWGGAQSRNGYNAGIYSAGGNIIEARTGAGDGGYTESIRDILVPAGQNISLFSSLAGYRAWAWVEVLS